MKKIMTLVLVLLIAVLLVGCRGNKQQPKENGQIDNVDDLDDSDPDADISDGQDVDYNIDPNDFDGTQYEGADLFDESLLNDVSGGLDDADSLDSDADSDASVDYVVE
ncbi:hypothetical protein HYW21_09135 [Candidatus Woesearchaeota archaeon]|nr:hypothetical protein [Candidatus Woesearchaeota archaeon]